jgi:hypothetical protein
MNRMIFCNELKILDMMEIKQIIDPMLIDRGSILCIVAYNGANIKRQIEFALIIM